MNKWVKRTIVSLASLSFLLIIGLYMLTAYIYNDAFNTRYDTDINFDLNFNHNDFENIKRDSHTINFNKESIEAWLYTSQMERETKGLILLVHGMGDGHLSYLSEINHLVNAGYDVFTFDQLGTGESSGDGVRGFPQGIINLREVLNYINNDSVLNKFPLGLYGHSWGGYTSLNILNDNINVNAVISRSANIDSNSFFMSQANKSAGDMTIIMKPFVSIIEFFKFGKVASYNAINGINKSNIPTLLLHSKDDTMIPYEITPYYYKDQILNTNVEYMLYEDKKHDVVLSDDAIKYQSIIFHKYKDLKTEYEGNIPNKDKLNLLDTVDKIRFHQLDLAVMSEVVEFYDTHLNIKK